MEVLAQDPSAVVLPLMPSKQRARHMPVDRPAIGVPNVALRAGAAPYVGERNGALPAETGFSDALTAQLREPGSIAPA